LFSVWKTAGKTSGYKKEVGLLELRTVNNAGHLVPMDQGEASLNMVKAFVYKCTGKTVEESDKIIE
jgi:carboxypeptidase C (cathepsin A)